jgi:hypothetical protein
MGESILSRTLLKETIGDGIEREWFERSKISL